MPQQSPLVPFGEWMPDQLATFSAGATVAKNCRTQRDDYVPQMDLGVVTSALGERCVGAYAFRDSTGTVHQFAGTATKLYKLSGTAWADVSRSSGGAYTTTSEGWWAFISFGDRVMATNQADDVQSFVVGSSSVFAALAGMPPDNHGMTVINNFVVAFGITGFNQRVQWSALNNPTDWTPSLSTQSDYNDILGEGGAVQWVAGGQNTGIVVMQKEIWRMTYVGGSVIFQFDRVAEQVGTPVPRSVASYGDKTFFLSESGPALLAGNDVIPIGDDKVDNYFYGRVNRNYLRSRTMAVSDPKGRAVLLAYPGPTSSDGTLTHALVCAITNRYRWTEIEKNLEVLLNGLTVGLTLNDLTTLYGTLDNVPFSLGSAVWQGGSFLLAGFNTDHRMGFFDGDEMTATLETAEVQLNPGGYAVPDSVQAMTDASAVQVQVGYRDLPTADVTYTAAQTPQASTGECNFEAGAKYHRARVVLSGTWTVAKGVQVRPGTAGGV